MVRGKTLLLRQWLWTADLAVAGSAILILLIGLVMMPRMGTARTGTPAGMPQGAKIETVKTESLLIAAANSFHDWLYPKPKAPPKVELPPVPVEKPTVAVVAPPVVAPVPQVPVQPVIPPPNFTLDFTMVFANRYGVASVRLPTEAASKLVKLGEVVDNYQITRITDGEMELKREGKSFTLKVPAPNPVEIQAAVAANPTPQPGRQPNLQTYPANNGPRPAANPGFTPAPTPGYTPPAVNAAAPGNPASRLPSGPGPQNNRSPQRPPIRR